MTKSMQEKMISYYRRYARTTCDDVLGKVYRNCSDAKWRAWNNIIAAYGTDIVSPVRVISHNSNFFSTGAIVHYSDGDRFIVETAYNTFTCGYSNGELIDLDTAEIFYTHIF